MSQYSNYLLEVIVNDRPVKEYNHEGHEYIEGRKGSAYKLRFRNKSNYRVLVIPSVDGLDVLDGKPAGVTSRGYVVPAHSFVDIPGWRISDSKVAQFEFAPQSDNNKTYVEELRNEGFNVDPANQGVIGVMVFTEKLHYVNTFHASAATMDWYDVSYSRPRGISPNTSGYTPDWSLKSYSQNNSMLSGSGSAGASAGLPQNSATWSASSAPVNDAPLGTAWGQEQTFQTQQTTFERANPYQPTYVQVYTYDTIQGLRKRGVPVDEPVKHPVTSAFPASPYIKNDGAYVPKSKRR